MRTHSTALNALDFCKIRGRGASGFLCILQATNAMFHVCDNVMFHLCRCEDRIAGQGKLSCPRRERALRGDTYEGSFLDGVPHGHCRFQRSDGQFQEGLWEQGVFVSGDACLKLAQDATYLGKCKGSKPHGLGGAAFLRLGFA